MSNFKKIMASILSVVTLAGSCLVTTASAAEVSVTSSGGNTYTIGATQNFKQDWKGAWTKPVNSFITGGVWSKYIYTTEFFMSASPQEFFIGDLNCDGYIDTNDLLEMRNNLKDGTNFLPWYNCIRDTNQDGKINNNDYYYLRNYLWEGGSTTSSNFAVVGYTGRHMSVYKQYHYPNTTAQRKDRYDAYTMGWRMDWRTVNGSAYGRTKYYINGKSSTRSELPTA